MERGDSKWGDLLARLNNVDAEIKFDIAKIQVSTTDDKSDTIASTNKILLNEVENQEAALTTTTPPSSAEKKELNTTTTTTSTTESQCHRENKHQETSLERIQHDGNKFQ